MVARNNPILANKEDANFREALKLFDSKQYKKALKLVEANIKKNSSHAESLALKGVLNHHLGHKAEAKPFITKAVSKEPGNYLVDHLAGIYFRTIDDYPEAAKWLKASIDNGSPNRAILRDLALLQSQIRDYKNLRDTRQAYLEFQPGYRANWTATAIAQHLNKDYNAAVNTLTKIEDIIKPHLTEADLYEQSECCLYKNYIVNEAGNYTKALELLEKDEKEITDRLSFLEYKAKYLVLLGQNEEASLIYRQLLQRNPDNVDYYTLLETALGTSSKPFEYRLKLYEKLARFYPRSDPPKFIPLTFLPSDHPSFEQKARDYVESQLKRGVPSTFVNIKPLYKNIEKLKVIEKIVLEFFKLQAPSLNPTVTVWSKYFLAQHYLYLNDLVKANDYIDSALDHSPTLVELYIVKARIIKHFGDYEKASQIMNEARELDLQDRFINSKTTKYLLRANKVNEAIDCISLFTKLDDDAVNGCKDLHLMQVNWVLIESAEAYTRIYHDYEKQLKDLSPEDSSEESLAAEQELKENIDIFKGLALKRYHAVIDNFKIFFDDQFDFHSYCMRRATPRDYIETLKWEDKLHSTPIYVRTIKGLSSVYWEIYEQQQKQKEMEASNEDKESSPAKSKKSNKNKKKKEKAQNIKRKAELISKVESTKEDPDPLGAKLLTDLVNNANGKILDLLLEYIKKLTTEADSYQITWELAFKLYKENSKYVLALQALKNLDRILKQGQPDKKFKVIAKSAIELLHAAENDPNSPAAIAKVVEKGLQGIFPELSEGKAKFEEIYA
ncbi:N-terminal acetyltransferase A, auxiliary subunit [Hyphopichia burtonii NRRL Y-1933]|uniref:N-terminal acetyltransferase A, auxiliary subunit n=1 Tax=Hyphopichia burtonii NRRL Y-1933 TaxID=984485 RepID=A0A1E4RT12_9ASCO|nr:N-terminal acetyltransferase A, auxiliary subunit [Hyphopichia burtonii NRRL Y-1933]ODV70396.1 N-terminal acetyltransferase A, auxiliary subunit [Hyphopichia burtonii NRRL Y-1933]